MKKKRFADGGMGGSDYGSDMSGGLPPVSPSLSDDQIAGQMKAKKLRQTYGPTQDERDRMERANLTAEATGTSPVYRSVDGRSGSMGPIKKMAKGGMASKRADGCCSKGKTKGRIV
jgi:hypothetical protein